MKRMLLASSIAALLLASTSALAQPDRHGRHDRDDRNGRYDQRYDHRHDRRWDQRRDHRRDDVRHDNGRHLGWYKQSFRRGQRVPVVYLQPRYYVNDYRAYRLAPPPYGYRWVRPYQDSNEYLLVQVATGLIMQVLGY